MNRISVVNLDENFDIYPANIRARNIRNEPQDLELNGEPLRSFTMEDLRKADLLVALPKPNEPANLDFIFKEEYEEYREKIGSDLRDLLKKQISPKPKNISELVTRLANDLDCDKKLIKDVFAGKESLPAEYIHVLKKLYNVDIRIARLPSDIKVLVRNVLKEIQKSADKERQDVKEQIYEFLLRFKNKIKDAKDDMEKEHICESLMDTLHKD